MRVALNFRTVGARRGGAETYVGLLARALDAAGHEVHVLAAEVDEGELPASVTVHLICTQSRRGLRFLEPYHFAAASARKLEQHNFDLVVGFAHSWRQDVCVAINGCRSALVEESQLRFRSAGRRRLWRMAKMLSPRQWVYHWIEGKQFRQAHPFVIAPSHRVAEDLFRWHQVEETQVAVVPLGIELAGRAYVSQRKAFRQQHELKTSDVAILFAARNYALKGLRPLLEAFAPVARRCPQAQLLVCGSNRDQSYRALARRLGIAQRVRFLGVVDDSRPCFAAADVFALPSFYDACSLVVLEALAAGVPVVTTRANGASELVRDGFNGYVIDGAWNRKQFSKRLFELVSNDALRQQMSRHAGENVERLSIEHSVQTMLDVLVRYNRLRTTQRARSMAA